MNKKVIIFLIILLAIPYVLAQDGITIKWIEPSLEPQDTNTAPTLEELPIVKISEGSKLTIELNTFDLEGDALTINAELPKDATLEENTFTWTPSYEFVDTKSCWHWWLARCNKKISIPFTVTDGKEETTRTLEVKVVDAEAPKDEIESLINELNEIIKEDNRSFLIEDEEVNETVEKEITEEDIISKEETQTVEEENKTTSIIEENETISEEANETETVKEDINETEQEEKDTEEIEQEIQAIINEIEQEETNKTEEIVNEDKENIFIRFIRWINSIGLDEPAEEINESQEDEILEIEIVKDIEENKTTSIIEENETVSEEANETETVEEETIEKVEIIEEDNNTLVEEITQDETEEIEIIQEENKTVEEETIEKVEETVEKETEEVEETQVVIIEETEEETEIENPGLFSSKVTINEGQKLEITLSVQDPDMDEVQYTAENLPEEAILENGTFTWTPSNGFVDKKSCWHYWISPCYKKQTILFTASDQELETKQKVEIKVVDENSPPILEEIENITINERETIKIEPNATDLDGDKITFKINEPFNKELEWTPSEGETGNFSITLTATDGKEEDIKEFNVQVLSVEAIPVINSYMPEEAHLKINESENISFSVDASDDDGDELTYSWKINSKEVSTNKTMTLYTTYTSKGAYIIQVDVNDTKGNMAQMAWTVSIEDVNRAPMIEEIQNITVNEGEKVKLNLEISDEDKDKIYYQISEPIGNDLEWQTGYEDEGEYEINITATDGIEKIEKQITVTVLNVNAEQPRINSFTPIEKQVTIEETEEITFSINATDPDGEEIKYSWLVNGKKESGKQEYIFETDYESEGVYNITGTASDGEKETSINWEVAVRNKNRAPNLDEIPNIEAKEGDLIELDLPETDEDGDKIYYTIDAPFNNEGKWQTTHEDAGTHEIEITATDTKDITKTTINVKIENNNRVPLLTIPEDTSITEEETITFKIEATDLDKDEIELSVENLPPNATFENGDFEWTPGYGAVNRMEDGNEKEYEITFIASDGTDKVKDKVTITVTNVNRAPVLEPIGEVYAKEGSKITLNPIVNDPDGDNIEIEYSGWMSSESKKASYEDEGKHIVTITASDGIAKDSEAAVIIVGNTNRAPVIQNITTEVKEPKIGMTVTIEGQGKIVEKNWLTGLLWWR